MEWILFSNRAHPTVVNASSMWVVKGLQTMLHFSLLPSKRRKETCVHRTNTARMWFGYRRDINKIVLRAQRIMREFQWEDLGKASWKRSHIKKAHEQRFRSGKYKELSRNLIFSHCGWKQFWLEDVNKHGVLWFISGNWKWGWTVILRNQDFPWKEDGVIGDFWVEDDRIRRH